MFVVVAYDLSKLQACAALHAGACNETFAALAGEGRAELVVSAYDEDLTIITIIITTITIVITITMTITMTMTITIIT